MRLYLRPTTGGIQPPVEPTEKSNPFIIFPLENKDRYLFILKISTGVLVTPGTKAPAAMLSLSLA